MTPATAPTSPATLDRIERSLVALMGWLTDRDTVATLARRSGHALAPASWSLLEHLDTRGPLRVSDVAACHGVHTSSIIPRLKALEAAGLIQRGSDPDDARVSMIDITAAGREALTSIHEARRHAIAAALDGLDPTRLDAAADVLGALTERVAARRA